jgi:hypothetical protein
MGTAHIGIGERATADFEEDAYVRQLVCVGK